MDFYDLKTGERISLESVGIECDVINSICAVQMSICHSNKKCDLYESSFRVPIPNAASVYFFQAKIDKKIIKAECKEKQQAKQEYDKAISEGRDAYLMRQHDDMNDVFEISLGNIPKGKRVEITLKYVLEMQLDQAAARDKRECYELVIPVLQRERYNDNAGSSKFKIFNKKHEDRFKFNAKVATCRLVEQISAHSMSEDGTSVSQPLTINTSYEADAQIPQFSVKSSFDGTRDLRIKIAYKPVTTLPMTQSNSEKLAVLSKPVNPVVMFEAKRDANSQPQEERQPNAFLDEMHVVMLSFVPRSNVDFMEDFDAAPKTEFVFVIDRSGSMSGSRIKCAKECLLVFLKSLPSLNTRIQIIGFGSTFNCAFPEMQPYTEDTMNEALDYQAAMDANMGGTEILPALSKAYKDGLAEGYRRCILLMTDGDVGNQHEVMSMVRRRTAALHNRCQLFTIGMGDGFSTSLVEGLARAGRGMSECARDAANLTGKVMHILQSALSPQLEEIKVRVLETGQAGEQAEAVPLDRAVCVPEHIQGGVMINQSLTVYVTLPAAHAHTNNTTELDELSLELTGKLTGEQERVRVVLPIGQFVSSQPAMTNNEDMPIHRMLAKCQIDEMQEFLEEKKDVGQTGTEPNTDTNTKPDEELTKTMEKQIVELSCQANVASNLTAFVAVDQEKMTEIQRPKIPELPEPKFFSAAMPATGVCYSASPQIFMDAPQYLSAFSMEDDEEDCVEDDEEDCVEDDEEDCVEDDEEDCMEVERDVGNNALVDLVSCQHLRGYWPADSEQNVQRIKASLRLTCAAEQITTDCPDEQTIGLKISANVWLSMIVLGFLELHCMKKREEWIMLAKKCETWIRNELKTLNGAEIDLKGSAEIGKLRQLAEKFLRDNGAAT